MPEFVARTGLARSASLGKAVPLALFLSSCGAPAPASRFPDAEAAIARMRATYACSRGIVAEAKVDYIDGHGRIRGNVSVLASLPDRTRLDAFSPFGVSISTLTTDQGRFAYFDLRQRTFLQGDASPCNIARFTQVPMPAFALVQLLRGEAPILRHATGSTGIVWDSHWFSQGNYRLQIQGQYESVQIVDLVPHPDDFARPWQEQRVRVLGISLEQQRIPLYRVEFEGHRGAPTSKSRVDPDGLDPDVPPSGPVCAAEVPRRMRIIMPEQDRDMVIHFERVEHNPPLVPGAFQQMTPDGVLVSRAECHP